MEKTSTENNRKIFRHLKHPRKNFLFLKIKMSIFKLLNKMRLINFMNVKINNKRMLIPLFKGIGLQNLGADEPWMRKLIEKLCRLKDGALIDVGVNIGQTLIQWKACNSNRPYYGFEPNPVCCQYVKELILKNNFQDCELFTVGLSDKNEVTVLFSQGFADSSASIVNGFRADAQYSMKTNVAVFKGDDLLERYSLNSISIIKIDVEGAELEVIHGLSNTIISHRPFIICEVLPVYTENTNQGKFRKQRQTDVEFFLKSNKYKIFRISADGNLIPLDSFGIHSNLALCNYLFAPEEYSDKLGIFLR